MIAILLPIGGRTKTRLIPPSLQIAVRALHARREVIIIMQKCTNSAHHFGINELAGAFPLEVVVVQMIVGVQNLQMVRQIFHRFVLIHVNVRAIWSPIFIVFWMGAHDHWDDLPVDQICVKFVGDIIATIGFLECQIEFVFLGE